MNGIIQIPLIKQQSISILKGYYLSPLSSANIIIIFYILDGNQQCVNLNINKNTRKKECKKIFINII